jgi:hypothetical protein
VHVVNRLPAEGVQLAQNRHERVIGRLQGEVVTDTCATAAEGAPAARDLEARGAQEQRVQALERLLAVGSATRERLDPAHGLGIEGASVDIERGLGQGDPS